MHRDQAFVLASLLASELKKIAVPSLPEEAKGPLAVCFSMVNELTRMLNPAPAQAGGEVVPLASVAVVEAAAPPVKAIAAAKAVLIIDDDEDMQKTLRFLLPKKGNFEVHSLLDPREAVAYLKNHAVALVLMDLMMPHMTGFELLTQLRAEPSLAAVKVIVGSSRSYDKDRVTVLKVGADDFIAKPYNFSELILRLKRLAA